MRRVLPLALCIGALVTTASCGDGNNNVFADAQWQARCPPGVAGCSFNGDPVDVFNFDGEEDEETGKTTVARCSVVDSGETRIIGFQVGLGTGAGDPQLSGNGLTTGIDGGRVGGSGCTISVRDDNTIYTGACGVNEPSAAQPCRVGPIVIDRDAMDGPEMLIPIECRELPSPSGTAVPPRDITFPMMPTQPANLRLINCDI
ncbi:MAG TPA: hypothetical protein RMI62_23640 [Polyangiaceae bacterium LLY-WYZ-15_(1-7)]|nr:hypothetical protein [Polyangiaceae bacterium LLY-WYZ-15_(1-7)]